MIGPPLSPGSYPFTRLDAAKAEATSKGIDLIDLGMGDPQEDTPGFIRQALIDGLTRRSSYPRASGLVELRQAIAAWLNHRFTVTVDPDQEILPTFGSKEIIHSLAAYTANSERSLVAVPSPAYPVYDRGARFHGLDVLELPLTPSNGFLPDLEAVSPATWDRVALLWLNYPNNPTGVKAPLAFYRDAAELARRHGFWVASDEAYSEIYAGEPPASILQVGDLNRVLCINTLSKRSCMTGYRSGFLAGDRQFLERLTRYRPSVGVTPQDFVQRASIRAWEDEDHVIAFRNMWNAKRAVLTPVLQTAGLQPAGAATFFLWTPVVEGYSSEQFADLLLDEGLVVSPGSFFGAGGEGFVRFALVPSLQRCQDAADRLQAALFKLT